MRIKALRLAEVGPFRDPVALEGFSGGFDVFTAPNETGKSTLLAALGTLLSERHTTTSREVAALRSYGGGAPLIEAEFELDGRTLRLRKRYVAQRMAELQDLTSGSTWRGADAEAQVDALLGGEQGGALRGLLWVEQGRSFTLPDKPGAPLSESLSSIVEREAAGAAGAGLLRRVGEEVRARLEQRINVRSGKAKVNSALLKAQQESAELAARLVEARARADGAASRLERQAELIEERARAMDAALHAQLTDRVDRTRTALEHADKARELLRLASEKLKAHQLQADQARAAWDRYRQATAEAARLESALSNARGELAALQTSREDVRSRLEQARAALAAAEASLSAGRRDLQSALARRAHLAARAKSSELGATLAAAKEAADAVASAKGAIEASSATEEAIEEARNLTARLDALDERIAAEAVHVSVAYQPAAGARFRIAGRELRAGEPIAVDRRIEIEVEGIGTIAIEPGLSTTPARSNEQSSCRTELERLLQSMRVSSLDDAVAALAARRAHEAALAESSARLRALAPGGIAAIERALAIALVEASLPVSDDAVDFAEPETLERKVAALEADVAAARTSIAALTRQESSIDVAASRIEGQITGNAQRLDAITTELPAVEHRAEREAELERGAVDAAACLSDIVRERAAWAEAAPSDADRARLVAEAAAAAAAVSEAATRRARIEQELAEIEGAMRRDREDGVIAEVARLEEETDAAAERLADVQADVDALALLAERLGRISQTHRDRVLRPLVERVEPLLARLFPDARLIMEGPLLVAHLERSGQQDSLARVSDGTREQIATLVRVAYAGLLAGEGRALPLVLDDALVFSDDVRLEQMVGLLAEAAQQHQVIMLSCHQRALAPLTSAHAASRLHLVPWTDPERDGARPPDMTRKSRAASPASKVSA